MERKYKVLIVVVVTPIIIVAAMVPISIFPPPLTPIDNLEWGVEVGDSFQFRVRTIGNSYGGIYSSSEIHHLNDSVINATLTALPTVTNIFAESFTQDVVLFYKVNCTFANGTSLSPIMELILCEGISGCTLPIGNWTAIAGLYTTEMIESDPASETFAAVLYDEYLYFQYYWFGPIDDNGGWWGDSSLETGETLNVLWFYEHQGSRINIELTPVT